MSGLANFLGGASPVQEGGRDADAGSQDPQKVSQEKSQPW